MVIHGWPKVIPPGGIHGGHALVAIDRYVHYIAGLGLPPWLAYVSAFTEFVGGMCLIAGLFTRFFSFLVAINMVVAIVLVCMHTGYFSSEYPIALVAVALMLVFAGPGKAALDRKIGFS
jgi:putative oxidoreductase